MMANEDSNKRINTTPYIDNRLNRVGDVCRTGLTGKCRTKSTTKRIEIKTPRPTNNRKQVGDTGTGYCTIDMMILAS
jgi:hypothetical protein